ncbi:MAG: S8 family serine peptidase, partial [Dokdonella sp.]
TSNGFLRGLGMAPGANLIEQLYDPTFTQAGGMLKLMTDSVGNHAVMSGNSWGPSGIALGYDDDTRQVDVGVRDADPAGAGDQPLPYVRSVMNGDGGTSSQGPPDEGKNLFTIGSTWLQDSPTLQNPDIDDLSSNSAHGPALDGRSIPALVAPGCDVDSSASATGYELMCGTSMASPHVTGASALFVQYYRGVFGNDPSPALIKAAFTAVAKNLTGHLDADGHVMTHLFDSKQGWGRLQIDPVLAPPQSVQYVDQTTVFDNTGETWTHGYQADDPSQPIRIMLVWTDAPGHGLGGSTPAWNNDLDLRVVAGATTYLGNALDNDGWSVAGGSADTKNNTEAVFLQPAQHGGAVAIEVLAADINSDGLPNSGDDTDQDFALVCYNCRDAEQTDMSVSATAAPNPVAPGQTLVYTIEAADAGPAAATAVKATLALPAGTTFAGFGGGDWTCVPRRDIVGCDYAAALPSGAAAAPLTISALVGPSVAGTLTATISIDANGTDANAANDTVQIVTEVLDRIFSDGFEQAQTP